MVIAVKGYIQLTVDGTAVTAIVQKVEDFEKLVRILREKYGVELSYRGFSRCG